jgi:DMSO/TMAO reductase YedYZ molybdopterin-dependent catalytic subunit
VAQRTGVVGAFFGALVGAATTGVLYLLSVLGWVSFVPLDIANAVILVTPGQIATTTIQNLGVWGKRLLEISGVVGFILAYGVLGAVLVWFIRRTDGRWTNGTRWLGVAALCAVVPLLLILMIQYGVPANRATIPANSVLPLTLTLATAGAALVWVSTVLATPADPSTPAASPSRRAVLLRAGTGLTALALGSTFATRFAGASRSAVAGADLPAALPTIAPAPSATTAPTAAPTSAPQSTATTLTAPDGAQSTVVAEAAPTATAAPTAPPTATLPPAFVPAPSTRSEITEQQYLYVISSSTRDPIVDQQAWRLSIKGAVKQPYELSYDELLALPRQDQTSTMQCISNEVGNYLIGNCNWNGVSLRDLLERAGVEDGVVDVVFRAAEGYSDSMPLAKALDPTTLVAYGIDGKALDVKHGFPARIRVAGLYGEKNVKWLTEIELVKTDYKGYWQQRGWTDDATIYTTSVIDTGNPRLSKDPVTLENGMIALGGIAFAGDRGIIKVEVQTDGGDWQEAQLKENRSDRAWRLWRFDWTTEPGSHEVSVRATDGTGALQTTDVQDTLPNGATGIHRFTIEVV